MAETECVDAKVIVFGFAPVFSGVEFVVVFSVPVGVEDDIFRFFSREVPVFHFHGDPAFFIAAGENADAVFAVTENVVSASSDDDTVPVSDEFHKGFRGRLVDFFGIGAHGKSEKKSVGGKFIEKHRHPVVNAGFFCHLAKGVLVVYGNAVIFGEHGADGVSAAAAFSGNGDDHRNPSFLSFGNHCIKNKYFYYTPVFQNFKSQMYNFKNKKSLLERRDLSFKFSLILTCSCRRDSRE